jgi:hypothetical protein
MATVKTTKNNSASTEGHLRLSIPTLGCMLWLRLDARLCGRSWVLYSTSLSLSARLASKGVCSDVRDDVSLDACERVERVDPGRDDDLVGVDTVL